ncbi:MAG TPA: XRE family transcriptional regulator [Pseudonocardiaceae bacterium]|nr:XRE family transcriptional regulator [Pseudonocardiaceae bacterium]
MAESNAKLRALRERTPSRLAPGEPMSRAELAQAVNAYLWKSTTKRYDLDSHTIARYERGAVVWPSAHYRSGLRAVLGVSTDAELGFRPTPRGSSSSSSNHPVPALTVLDYGKSIDLGASAVEFLAELSVDTPVPACVGWNDVEHVRSTTHAVAMSDNLFGGGLSCEAAAGQLRWVGRLLDARTTDDNVRRALFEAAGNLGGVVAFAAFDIADYTSADRCSRFALWCADQSGSWALRADVLSDMARKATYLGNLDEALSLIEFAQVRSDRVSATARAMMSAIRARLLALTGRHADAQAEVDKADSYFADREPSTDPIWLRYYDEAEHQGSTGRALIPVAYATRRAELAAPRLESAIRLHNENYPRSRTFSRTRLATLLMAVDDPHEAALVGRQAVTDAASLRSQRVVAELQGLAEVSAPHVRIGDVGELRNNITQLALSSR